jgi:hypothetical protein
MTKPTLAWFQPAANFAAIAAMGHTAVSGPEPAGSDQNGWAAAAKAAGLSVILKNPRFPLPDNCIGMMLSIDEPNEPKNNNPPVLAAALQPEFGRLRASAPLLPIYLTLGGDRLLYGGFPSAADRQMYQDYAALGDVTFAVDFYPCNRSSKYPMNFPAMAVANIRALTGKPVIAILEANDQQLGRPGPGETNGMPTPQQIQQQATAALDAGSAGLWWFYTCQAAKYGWPGSYLPQVDRNLASTAPQYAMVKQINALLNPGLEGPPATATPTNDQLNARLTAIENRFNAMIAAGGAK